MTARIQPLDVKQAQGHTQEMFNAVKSKFGMVPNLLKTMGQAPALLEGYLAFSGALGKGALSPQIREQVALYVSQYNGCEYCLAGHSLTAKMAGLTPERIVAARQGKSAEAKAQAVLDLTKDLLERRGRVSDERWAAAQQAGVSDAEILEVVGHVAATALTNYVNNAVRTELDFPKVPAEV